MKIELKKWSFEDKKFLIKMCNTIDRNYLSDRLPNPYTNKSAEWWLKMVKEVDEKRGVFRKIVVDGKIVGTISVEQKEDVYQKDSEIGYYLLQEVYSKVYEPNIASRKVLEKNNFLLEGVMKKAVFKNNNIYDLCIYGKLK